MSLRYTNIQNSRIPAKVGVCADSVELLAWTNGFEQRASVYGRWWGTTQLAQFCITGSCGGACIVLPPNVAVIEAANLNGMSVNVQNMWGQFIRPHASPSGCGGAATAGVPCNGFQPFACGCGCGCRAVSQMQDEGLVPSYSVTNSGERIKLYATQISDFGKKVVVQGNDSNGVWVRTVIDGIVQDGEQVTLVDGGVITNTIWGAGAPMDIYKEVTDYRVLMFALDTDDNERQLADYGPQEVNPEYRKVRLPGVRTGCGSGCGNLNTLRCLVSLQPTTIVGANDWLLFNNLAAYSDGILAEKYYENGDVQQGDAYFFGLAKPARNNRGVLRVAVGNGALPLLESELRKMIGDRTETRVLRDGLSLVGFV